MALKQRREAAQREQAAAPVEKPVSSRQGAVIGGWVCIALGTALMFWTLFSFLLYLPLFVAAFALGIVAIAQRRLWNGIPILLLSVAIPVVVGFTLGVFRASDALKSVDTPEAALHKAAPASAPASTPSVEQQYIDKNLELYEFTAKRYESVLDGKVPGVEFKIRNRGDKSLDTVKVVVYFKDAQGTTIAEENFTPVLVSEYNLSGNNKPLKPGYIWQLEKGKFYTAKSIPSEWEEGAAEAKIVQIRFSQTDQ
ncbi:hypothetical protein QA447_03545 [Pseudomonas sp. abacavir_1]